jgi:hypothetical protein
LILVEPSQLAHVWPDVVPWIKEAVEKNQGDENTLDVLLAIARGQYSLWADKHFAAVTQVVNYPRQRVLTILYIGGDLTNILPLFDDAKAYCKANKVDVLRTYGRPGWEKVTGLEKAGVILQTRICI